MNNQILEETTKAVRYFTSKISSSENLLSVTFFGILTVLLVVPLILLSLLYYWVKYPKGMAKKTRLAKVPLEEACKLTEKEKAECFIVGHTKNNLG